MKVLEAEPGGGKVKLSRKALMPVPAGSMPRPRTPLGRGARGSSAGVGAAGGGGGTFVRNPDGSLKRPLQRIIADVAAGAGRGGGDDAENKENVWTKPTGDGEEK